jgi:hypothetical protein
VRPPWRLRANPIDAHNVGCASVYRRRWDRLPTPQRNRPCLSGHLWVTTRPLSSIHWWTSSNSSFVNLIDAKSSNGRDRPMPSSTENLFRAVAVPAWPPPFNWLTTSSYPLSRCQIGSHQTGGGLLPSGGCHQGSTCTEAIGRTIRKSATAPALRGY